MKIISKITILASPLITTFWVLILSGFLILQKKIYKGISIILLFSLGGILLSIIKHLVARPRPIDNLVVEKTFSFPSGHTFGITLLALTVCTIFGPFFKKYKQLIICTMICLVVLIAFSRVYLFVHYPSDIIGGLLLAVFWWNFYQSILDLLKINQLKF